MSGPAAPAVAWLSRIQAGQAADVRRELEAVVAAGTATAATFAVLARACAATGDERAAQSAIDRGLALDRALPALWLEVADACGRRGDAAGRERALTVLHGMVPGHGGIAAELCAARLARGDLAGAAAVAQRAWAAGAESADLARLAAALAQQAGDREGARACAERWARWAPSDPRAWLALAQCRAELGDDAGELEALRRWVELEPASPRAHAALGEALARAGQGESARAAFGVALAAEPANLYVRWQHLHCVAPVQADVASFEAARRQWDADFAAFAEDVSGRALTPQQALSLVGSATNFYRHYLGEPILPMQSRYGALMAELAARAFPAAGGPKPPRRRRPRVAFVSSHFHEHTVLKLFGGWLGALPRRRYETWAFHLDAREDAATARVRSRVDRFVGSRGDLHQAVMAIRDAAPDVLVHLDVGMHPHSQVLAALRLAPVQAVAWGHPVTTGMPTIDAFLSVDAMEPPGGEAHYTEPLVRLPGIGIDYARPRVAPVPNPAAGALPPGVPGYVFCAQSAQKLHPGHDALFVAFARRFPAWPLVLLPHHDPAVRAALEARLGRAFAEAGTSLERHVVILPATDLPGFMAIAGGAALLLDSLDWSGGNTTLEALACGTPVLTCPGTTMRSRHTAAMLRLVGCDDLVAPTPDAMLDRAAALLEDADGLQRARDRIRERAGALFDRADGRAGFEAWIESALA